MVKITKALARKLFNEGKEIMVLPNKIRPAGKSKLVAWLTKSTNGSADEFTKLCEAMFHYNCNPKNGMDLVFYAKEV